MIYSDILGVLKVRKIHFPYFYDNLVITGYTKFSAFKIN